MKYASTKNSFEFLFSKNSLLKLAVFGSNFEKQMVLLFRENKGRWLSTNSMTVATMFKDKTFHVCLNTKMGKKSIWRKIKRNSWFQTLISKKKFSILQNALPSFNNLLLNVTLLLLVLSKVQSVLPVNLVFIKSIGFDK